MAFQKKEILQEIAWKACKYGVFQQIQNKSISFEGKNVLIG